MTDRHFFDMASMSYELHALRRELDTFKSGEAYAGLRKDYENIIRSQNRLIAKLRRERDEISFTGKQIPNQWQEVLDDMEKEHVRETKKLNRLIAGFWISLPALRRRMQFWMRKEKKHSAIITMLQQNWKMHGADYKTHCTGQP